MKRLCLLAIMALSIGTPAARAQNNNNVGMPWEALRAATRGTYEGLPNTAQKIEPFKVFDNVYYVGLDTIGSYLITTSDGLILMDTTYPDTADFVLENVRKLGFNPSNIKYILITHGHGDHFAGAGRIKQAVPAARIGSPAADWEAIEKLMATGNANNGLPFTRDLVIKDGDTLKLGDTELKFYVMPGHTTGNLVTEMQARGNGRTFRTLIGVAFAPSPGNTQNSINSLTRLRQLGPWDALLTSHSYLAPAAVPTTAQQIIGGEPMPANPTGHRAAVGAARINAYLDQILVSVKDRLAKEQSASPRTAR